MQHPDKNPEGAHHIVVLNFKVIKCHVKFEIKKLLS
jgi:hypothetical protein